MFSGKCTSKARLDGKTAIVTGANTGIGKETAKEFYRRGMNVCTMTIIYLRGGGDGGVVTRFDVRRRDNV